MSMANDEQNQLLRFINKLKGKTKPHNPESKKVKENVLNSALLKGREVVFKASESGISLKPEELKKGIALAHIKAGNDSESLLNEIRWFILCINQKKLPKKCIIT